MKKSVVAAVLAVSVLFTACSKKNSETSSESETTVSSSETSPTSSEKPSETSEEPTEPSKNEIVSYDVPAFKKINYLSYQIDREEVFTFLPADKSEDEMSGYNRIEYYLGCYGIPVFDGDVSGKLNEAVKEDFEKIVPNAREYFEGRKAEFAKRLGTEEWGIEYDENLTTFVLRADEKITTVFYPFPNDQDREEELTPENLINYDTATGKKIALSDVIKDRDLFTEVAKERIMGSMSSYDLERIKEEDVLAALDSDQIPFTIDYSGISLYYDMGIYGYNMRGPAHISFIGNEDAFKDEYFDVLPENYVLHIAPDTDFFWDLDGDGKTESLNFGIPLRTEFMDIDSFSISLDDQKTEFKGDDCEIDMMPEYLYLIHTHGQNFIYISTVGPDVIEEFEIFEITGTNVAHRDGTGKVLSLPWQNFDPDHVVFRDDIYVVGLETYTAVYHIDENGQPVTDENVVTIHKDHGGIFPCLKKDLKVDQVDPKTHEKTGTITLKAGTNLSAVATDRKTFEQKEAFEVFKVLDKDPEKEVYVRLDLDFAEDECEAKINGVSVRDLFARLFMGA